MISVFDRLDGYQHFLFYPQYFQKVFYSGLLKVKTVWERVDNMQCNTECD